MLKICLLLSLISHAHCIFLNQLNNFRIAGNTYQILYNTTESDCICAIMSSNKMMSSFNYLSNNQTCQLFYTNDTTVTYEWDPSSSIIYTDQSVVFSTFSKSPEGVKIF